MKTFEEYTDRAVHHNLKVGDYVRLNPLTMVKYFYDKYKDEVFIVHAIEKNKTYPVILDYTSGASHDITGNITGKWFGNLQYENLIKLDDYEVSALKYNL